VNDRPIASISIIDTLEHIPNDEAVLEMLHRLARPNQSPLIVSVPNVGHRDIAFKLLVGQWQYTQGGLLDCTHVFHHTKAILDYLASRAGWYEVAVNDVYREKSDQHFPEGHLALSGETWLGRFLRGVREKSDAYGTVNQFVRMYLPGSPKKEGVSFPDPGHPERPFLSVVIRTQGKRIATLRDVLLCLAAQSCQDFEVIVLAHKVQYGPQVEIERVIEDLPEDLRGRVRLELVDHGGRACPLNIGFGLARGRYISVVDDDDLIFANWVETFLHFEASAPGCVFRAVAVDQDINEADWDGISGGFRTVGPMCKAYPSRFIFFDHLNQNYSPLMSLAFPRSIFYDFNLRFDESLDTCEDWDYEMRAVSLCGYADTPKITSVYRKWKTGESSQTAHGQEVWNKNHIKIMETYDSEYRIYPPGTASRMRELINEIKRLEAELSRRTEAQGLNEELRIQVQDAMAQRQYLLDQKREFDRVVSSLSWKITKPLRFLARVLRGEWRVVIASMRSFLAKF
jgi:glycosyltransferase involved in cell wall biosynthesis